MSAEEPESTCAGAANPRFLVTVALPDRVGILRDATGALFARGANFTDLRQSVVGGVFTLLAVAEFPGVAPGAEPDPALLAAALRCAIPERDVCIDVRLCPPPATAPAGERYVAAFTGPDCPGRIHRIAKVFADRGVNVEDWRHDMTDPERTLTIGVVTLPACCDPAEVRAALEESLAPLRLAVSLLHENIFRATNEVGPIAELLGDGTPVSRNA